MPRSARPLRLLTSALVVLALGLPSAATSSSPAAAADAPCAVGTPTAEFSDPVAMSAGHARIWRLYQAFFLRQPDGGGFSYWYSTRARGASLPAIANAFASSREFQARYGTLDDGRFVDLVYRNVLCRAADAEGHAYWVDLLRSGRLARANLVINFAEAREYLARTRTCHSMYPSEDAGVPACATPGLRPLSQATLGTDGYQGRQESVRRVSGSTGSFRAVEVDLARRPLLFRTGADRCSIASINGNWVLESEKDRPNPAAIGIGLVDGVHVKGSQDRGDRGILGLRFSSTANGYVASNDQRLSSVLHRHRSAVVESWLAAAEESPELSGRLPSADGWVWAAAGTPLILGGQVNWAFEQDYVRDPYSHQTLRHSFVAHDAQTQRLLFGATSNLDTRDLVGWFRSAGYEELIKFDGGASTEMNVDRRPVVAGTSRDLPVWLGIGC